MADLQVHQFPCLSDNYGVLIHDAEAGVTASIDAPEENTVLAALEETGWSLTHILVTHYHADHTQGIAGLKRRFGARVIGPAGESDKIDSLDETVDDGDVLSFGRFQIAVMSTPGHTLGQVNYHIPEASLAFTGDTLFALGCGRVFEGSHAMMWTSLDKLRQALPPSTQIYCGHEYTLANARFAVSVDGNNEALTARFKEIEALRAAGKPTLPTTMEAELATNPFLRPDDPSIQTHLGMEGAPLADVFSEIRRRKDRF
ncbi:MAG: hydroxyacylglutathione hydrolase [Pseudomonadota bacterium]